MRVARWMLPLLVVTLLATGVEAVAAAGDLDRARAGRLRLSDMPTGWAARDHEGSARSGCAALQAAKTATTAHSSSPDFANVGSASIQNAVYLYRADTEASRRLAALSGPRLRACFRRFIERAVTDGRPPTGIRWGAVASRPLDVSRAGDGVAGARATLAVDNNGSKQTAVYDLVVVRVGRALSLLVFTDLNHGFSHRQEARLTKVAARRVAAALRGAARPAPPTSAPA